MQSEIVVMPVEQVQDVVAEAVRGALGGVTMGTRESRELDLLQRKEALSDKEVQLLFGINAGTLRNWRSQGRGPSFVKDGKVILYRRKDLETYMQGRRVKTYDQG